jgi:transposase
MIWGGGCCRRSSGASTTDRDLSLDGSFVLRVPAGYDDDLSGAWMRTVNRLRDLLLSLAPALEREIEALFRSPPQAAVLLSIPGIGVKTGARILTEIGDVDRFPDRRAAGRLRRARPPHPSVRLLDPRRQKSRRDNQRLKNALWLSTFCSLRNKCAAAYYARKRAEGKKHNAVVICLARGRCDLVHKLLRTGLTYGELPRAPSLPPQIPSRSPSNPLDKSIGTRPSLHDFLHAAPAASEHGGGS